MLAVIAPRCRHDSAPIANSCSDCLKMSRKELFELNFCQFPSASIRRYKPLLPIYSFSSSSIHNVPCCKLSKLRSRHTTSSIHKVRIHFSSITPRPLHSHFMFNFFENPNLHPSSQNNLTSKTPPQIHTNLSQCLHQRPEISSQRMFPSLTSQPPRRLNPSRPVA